MKLLIIRPEPGASATAERVKSAGLDPILLPLFAITPKPWSAPPPENFDALLFTSANAVRHAGAALDAYRALPAHAVGERTAAALRKMGIEPVWIGIDGIDEFLRHIGNSETRFLWLSGEHRTEQLIDPKRVHQVTCYASNSLPVSLETAASLPEADAVALHSPRAARHFCDVLDQLGIAKSSLFAATFSPAIAEAAGTGWRGMAVAAQPTDSALLSALAELVKLPPVASSGRDKE